MAKERRVLRLQFVNGGGAGWWELREPNGDVYWGSDTNKRAAIAASADICRTLQRFGEPAQLVVHEKDGTFGFERTYGADPVRYKS